jgi:hypothetical protein
MVSPKHDAVSRQADSIGNLHDEPGEAIRAHSRVSPELVYLIGCRLDQKDILVLAGPHHR